MKAERRGDFTLPGEAGYEKLTLELAEKWGADVIRDSDGTKLSPEITAAGYRIYSTICIIREHNEFAEAHPDASGFECRFCAGTDVPVHELRFHPYLFPVGLGGLPGAAGKVAVGRQSRNGDGL